MTSPNPLATAFVVIRPATAGFSTALKRELDTAGSAAAASGSKTGAAWSKSFQSSGVTTAAKRVTEGILAIGAASVYSAVKFQASMAKLNTQAGVSQSRVKALGDGVLALAGKVGFSPDSLAASLYHVESNFESLGITGPKALNLVRIAAEGAKVGGADLVDVTNALTAAVASGIKGVSNFSGAMGVLNKIVGVGDMTMQDLATAFSTGLLASVKGFGVSITDVGAALATFGDNNIRGAKAGTQLRMAVQALAAPTAAGAKNLISMGIASGSLAKDMEKGGLKLALEDLAAKLKAAGYTSKQTGAILTETFGKRAGVGIQILIGQMDRFESKFPRLEAGATGFGAAWNRTQQTAKQQAAEVAAGFDALGTKIGEKLLPPLQALMRLISGHVSTVTGLAVAIGATAVAITAVSYGMKAFAIVSALAKGAMLILTGEQWALNTAMDANPIGAIILALTALVAGLIYAYTHFKWFHDAVNAVFASTLATAAAVWNGLKTGFDVAWRVIKVGIKAFADDVLAVFGFIVHGAAAAFGWVPGIGPKLQAAARQFDVFHAAVDRALSFPPRNVKVGVLFTASLPPPGHAAGGLITGGTPGRDSVMGALMPGELVVPTHMVRAGAVDHLRGRLPGFAAGGLVGGGLSPRISFTPIPVVDKAVASSIQSLAQASAQSLFNASGGGSGGGGQNLGGGVSRWAPVILAALGLLGQSPSWLGAVESRMGRESGGNPAIVNKWDSNWLAGTPSVGLMQVIGPTYAAYAGPFRNTGPFEYGVSIAPLANIYAGLNYAIHRYGGLGVMTAPGGYDNGGWLPPGVSVAVNRTGHPEQVIGPRGSGGNTYHITCVVPPNANMAEIGRISVEAIKQYERRSGSSWRR